jgi:hypothetical protein
MTVTHKIRLMLLVALLGTTRVMAAASHPPAEVDGYLQLGFDRLAGYHFKAPPYDPAPGAIPPMETGDEQIPKEVKSWNGRKAIVTGFMLPVKMDGGLVTELLLMRDQMMCCYGVIPNMNEWVVVRLKKGVRPLLDVPVAFHGELKVGAMFEQGFMVGIYLLDGEKMTVVEG